MSSIRRFDPNPERYRELAKPHESPEQLNFAINKFRTGVEILREELGIPDVLVAITASVRIPEQNEETQIATSFFFGDLLHAEKLAAFAYGQEKQFRDAMIEDLLDNPAPTQPLTTTVDQQSLDL